MLSPSHHVIIYIIPSGSHHHHADLTMEPWIANAVCCSSQYIFTIQYNPPLLSVYNWAATRLCELDRTKLQLTGNDYPYDVGSVSEDSIMLAVGDLNGDVKSLHKYKVL